MVACADLVQEHGFPESEGAWGEARPACRGHRHPAKPTVLDGEAWWICPNTGQRLSLIGTYDGGASTERAAVVSSPVEYSPPRAG